MSLNDSMSRYYSSGEGRLALAEQIILETYGDRVSVERGHKTLRKFGYNPDIDVGIEETVWASGGIEVLPTDNTITTISSSDAGDVQTVLVEGHTVEGTGEDARYTFVTQSVTLQGHGQVALTTPLARASRAYNVNSVDFSGNIYIYEDDTTTLGVPDTASKIHITIPIGTNQTRKAATTVSDTDYFLITSATFSVLRGGAAAAVDFFIEVRPPGKVFRPVLATVAVTGGSQPLVFDPCIIVPKNHDVRVQAISNTNNTPVAADIAGYLAAIL